jgi:hypothetical protein
MMDHVTGCRQIANRTAAAIEERASQPPADAAGMGTVFGSSPALAST